MIFILINLNDYMVVIKNDIILLTSIKDDPEIDYKNMYFLVLNNVFLIQTYNK